MSDVAINHLRTRITVPRDAMREQARLKRIVSSSIERDLESAIQRRSISVNGYLCIRKLHAKVRLRLSEPDSALAEAVAHAIAEAISGAVRGESGIYYSSRAHALIDLASSAMRADLDRSWAWSQLGIWQDSAPRSASSHANLVIRALATEPRLAAGVLAHLAPDGSTVPALLRWADVHLWWELAAAASRVHGSSIDFHEVHRAIAPSELARDVAEQFVRKSLIARTVSAAKSTVIPDTTLVALARLVVLEVEPAVIRSSSESVRAVVDSIALLIRQSLERGEVRTTATSATPTASSSAESDERSRMVPQQESVAASVRPPGYEPSPKTGNSADAESGPSITNPSAEPFGDQAPLEVRRSAVTKAGGLVYLLNAISRIDLPAAVMRDHRLTERGLRWTLHQLALILLPMDADDPAALALAGLLPDARPPSVDQDPAREDELIALEEYRVALIAYLRKALADRLEPADLSDDALIAFVCCRRATISGDPGWIEVWFPIEEVSPKIRFAGLDLDPEWIPWLGVVVKFIYA